MSKELVGLLDQAKSKFCAIIQGTQRVSPDEAAQIFEVESFTFRKQIEDTPTLLECSNFSMGSTFLAVISNGLSFNSAQKQVFLMARNVKNATGGWDKQLVYQVTPDGNIFLCQRAGSIKDIERPTICYVGDTVELHNGIITYSPAIPRRSEQIIGGFTHIIHEGGRMEAIWVDVQDMRRHKSASEKQNKGVANALYSSGPDGQIDPGFFGAKIIKIALKNKMKKAMWSEYEVQEDEVLGSAHEHQQTVTTTLQQSSQTLQLEDTF